MTTALPDAPPDALVTTDWLAAHLDDPTVRIVDATWVLPGSGRDAHAEYRARHIPGAVFFDIDDICDPASDPPHGLPHMVPSPERFAAKIGALGIGNAHFVVCYDGNGIFTAARPWWMFRLFGHDRVAVLDGRLPKWLAEGRPMTNALPAHPPAPFTPVFRPELLRTAAQVQADIATGAEQIVDLRAADRFAGAVPDVWPGRRAGHIPGSLNLPFPELVDSEHHTLLPPERLAARLAAAGVAPGRPVVASCGSGITACVLALARHRLGDDRTAIYDGSWAEWGLLPIDTGAPG